MPAPPEVFDIAGGVGAHEIHAQGDSHAAGKPVGGETIATEVKIDAEGEQDIVYPDHPGISPVVCIPHGESQVICQCQFEKEPQDDVGNALLQVAAGAGQFHFLHLGQQVRPALNGAGHNLGEIGAEIHVVQPFGHGFIAHQGVDAEADNLKGVEGYADGDNQVAEGAPLLLENSVSEEIAVFIVDQRQQQQGNEASKQPFPSPHAQLAAPAAQEIGAYRHAQEND